MPSEHLVEFRTAYLRAIAKAWRDDDFREELLNNDNNAFDLLGRFGFDSPWAKLELKIVDSEDRWDPVKTGGWVGGAHDKIVVRLPRAPGPYKEHLWPAALAAYYQKFSTFLGPLKDNFAPPTDGLGVGGPENFLNFGAITIRALALGWNDSQFWELLMDGESALPALQQYLGYENPWNFNIVFAKSYDF